MQADNRISRIWRKVRSVLSPVFTLALIVVLSNQVTAVSGLRATMDQILERGIVQSSPQEIVSEWRSLPGIQSRIHTPRNRGESDAAVATRHADAVRALSEAFAPE